MLNWASRFSIFCFLDHRSATHADFDVLLGAGCRHQFTAMAGQALSGFDQWRAAHPGWCFGHLGYDLKNETGQLSSTHADGIGFPDLSFVIPEIVLHLKMNMLTIYADEPERVWATIEETDMIIINEIHSASPVQSRFSREEYLDVVQKLQSHIQRGDCYEINFCQEFYCTNANLHPLSAYRQLTMLSPNPFSAFYRLEDRYCICASPERYLRRTGDKLLSQPIKGTAGRYPDTTADNDSKAALQQSLKERSENVMVVDLVRNDLSRICREGSVKVEELFGIYSFPQVHQMISSISGELNPGTSFGKIIEASFPMGSMTGAPKQRVLQLIEQYERTKRGLFSGSIGYITPNGDFDFNVVIRSLFYNSSNQYLSFQVGGGITFYSVATQEYEECLLKAGAIMTILSNSA